MRKAGTAAPTCWGGQRNQVNTHVHWGSTGAPQGPEGRDEGQGSVWGGVSSGELWEKAMEGGKGHIQHGQWVGSIFGNSGVEGYLGTGARAGGRRVGPSTTVTGSVA